MKFVLFYVFFQLFFKIHFLSDMCAGTQTHAGVAERDQDGLDLAARVAHAVRAPRAACWLSAAL
jgi:hypothetical protein